MTVSAVICTRNRPADLAACLESLARQTRAADEVVIVDASDDDASATRVRELAHTLAPAAVRHLHAARGLPRQRNLGVRASRGDLVTFLDDDVVLDPGYLAAIVPLFEADPMLGGAEGVVDTPPLRGRRRLANDFRRFFAMNTRGRPRGVKRSGFVAYDPWPGEVRRVGSLVGCNMTYRRAVFAEFAFDEWYQEYALGEDQDFSYRVGRRFGLAQTPAARLEHRLSPVARETLPALHEMTAVHHWYFVRKNLPPGWRTWAAFAWSELGELLSVAKTFDRACVAAKVRGYRRIARGLARETAR
jgi:glycosyltransferase involved in cell wall biosynthesis